MSLFTHRRCFECRCRSTLSRPETPRECIQMTVDGPGSANSDAALSWRRTRASVKSHPSIRRPRTHSRQTVLQERAHADEARFFSSGESIERPRDYRHRLIPHPAPTGSPFLSLSLESAVPRPKSLPALRLELVAIGVLKADTIRCGRQSQTRGLHGENDFASVNLNQLPDMAV
jgi:hypothetical protein